MLSSTDSLKKKVCVTVFLDELFEEVEDENCGDPKQVSEVTESEVNIPEQLHSDASHFDLDNHEKINISPNADTEQTEVKPRLRKHRRESKFSENPNNSLSGELDKYGYGTDVETDAKSIARIESTVSDSDFDVDGFIGVEKCIGFRSSVTDHSELEMTEESFLSVNPVLSVVAVRCKKKKKKNFCGGSRRKLDVDVQSGEIVFCNRSTQFDGVSKEVEKIDTKAGSDSVLIQEEPKKTLEDALSWSKTQQQIQMILEKAKRNYAAKETCEGDQIRYYDLRSILEECEKMEEKSSLKQPFEIYEGMRPNTSTAFIETGTRGFSDSYTCVFPHGKQSNQPYQKELKWVWSNRNKNAWIDGFESDWSEVECVTYSSEVDLNPVRNDPLLCYTLCLKCRENVFNQKSSEEITRSMDLLSDQDSDSTNSESSDSFKSKSSTKAAATTSNSTNKSESLEEEENQEKEEKEKLEEKPADELACSDDFVTDQTSNKNFAEGDTTDKGTSPDSKMILQLESKEEMLVCDEILKHVDEKNVHFEEFIVNTAEVDLNVSEGKKEAPEEEEERSKEIAEVFVKNKPGGDPDKNMSEAESEMIFAETESEDFLYKSSDVRSETSCLEEEPKEDDNQIQVIEFEDKFSRSKVLKRMKTVEILGESSLNDMKNISTEVILICENLSSASGVCLEAWQSSMSTATDGEKGQFFLKDTKGGSMYLIEIPLHFRQARKPPEAPPAASAE